MILALPFLFLEINVFFTIIVIALTWKPLYFNQLQPILLLLHQSLWEYFLAMALDVAVKDGLLEFRHSFPSLCGDIQEVSNYSILGQSLENLLISFSGWLVDPVLLREHVKDEGWHFIWVPCIAMPLGNLLQYEL